MGLLENSSVFGPGERWRDQCVACILLHSVCLVDTRGKSMIVTPSRKFAHAHIVPSRDSHRRFFKGLCMGVPSDREPRQNWSSRCIGTRRKLQLHQQYDAILRAVGWDCVCPVSVGMAAIKCAAPEFQKKIWDRRIRYRAWEVPAREWWTCSIPSACARSGILAVCLIARRRNAAYMSMMPFSLVEMFAKSMCYNRRAYAPRTRVQLNRGLLDIL